MGSWSDDSCFEARMRLPFGPTYPDFSVVMRSLPYLSPNSSSPRWSFFMRWVAVLCVQWMCSTTMREILRSRASSDMTTKWGVLLSSIATNSTRGLFFLVRLCSFNRFQLCALRPASGDDYAGVALVWCQLLTHHHGSSSLLGSLLAVFMSS